MANKLNCKLGSLPMKYLGIPVSDAHLGTTAFGGLFEKMNKRLEPWKGKHLSSGGKLTLTNSCLSSLPMYIMGFYWLTGATHSKMDSIRANFFWKGVEKSHKYHMAKWEMVSCPKDQGGLGIINTRLMNDCLLVKWIWKIMKGSEGVWFKLLQAKYMRNGKSFFTSSSRGSSQFWQGLHKVKHLFKWGALFKVKDGEKVSLWEDSWVNDSPLKHQFPSLYAFCEDPLATIADCWQDGEWDVNFRRTFSEEDMQLWEELLTVLHGVAMDSSQSDEVMWMLDKSRSFATKSMYRFLTFGGVTSKEAGGIWKARVPLKIKVFIWQMFHKLPTATELVKRGWKGSHRCSLCGQPESGDHIFFHCSMARFTWCCLRDFFGWDGHPTSCSDFWGRWLPLKFNISPRLGIFMFAGLCWVLWITRNKMAFEQKFINKPTEVVFLGINFMQKWSPMLKEDDREKVEGVLKTVTNWLQNLPTSGAPVLDIVEI
ncbi:putative retroelement [Panicum miliaceum]|uniref:Retroelement n=1 Tax=Panicum miliaceum TaxID=4540 RepID=A0A3L6TC75_PANMI|nr:putative retroelement [Panicum miliaceum]